MPWVALLETGSLPKQNVNDTPPSWMTDVNWMELVERSLGCGDNATARLHLGVMKYERFQFEEGIAEWKKSLALSRNPWALRNLAVAEKRAGRLDAAIAYMEEALALEDNRIDKAFTEEYFDLLIAAGRFEALWSAYEALPESRKQADRILMQAGYAAVELDKTDFVEKLVDREFANIREGDNLLVDMWFKYATKREAAQRGVPYSEALYKEIRKTKLPPANFDFRMVDN
jgi:tetratricopeptide (TPR) repeat protein